METPQMTYGWYVAMFHRKARNIRYSGVHGSLGRAFFLLLKSGDLFSSPKGREVFLHFVSICLQLSWVGPFFCNHQLDNVFYFVFFKQLSCPSSWISIGAPLNKVNICIIAIDIMNSLTQIMCYGTPLGHKRNPIFEFGKKFIA